MGRPFLARALIGVSPASTVVLQNLRVLVNFWVVTGHTPAFTSIILDDLTALDYVGSTSGRLHGAWHQLNGVALWASVDVFLFVSGFFLAASLAKASGDDGLGKLRSCRMRSSQVARHMLSRWLRLILPYVVVAACLSLINDEKCVAWREIFFTGNLVRFIRNDPADIDECIKVGWSLSADFQSHFIVASLAALLPSWQTLSTALWMLALCTSARRASIWHANGAPTMSPVSAIDFCSKDKELQDLAKIMAATKLRLPIDDPYRVDRHSRMSAYGPIYYSTSARVAPLCVGALVWIALRNNTQMVRSVRRAPKFALVTAGALFVAYYIGTLAFFSGAPATRYMYLYIGWGRLGIALAIGVVVILTCWVGEDKEGPRETSPTAEALRYVLSNRFMLWLSRSSYAVFLVHTLTSPLLFHGWPRITRENYTAASNNWVSLKWYLVSLVAAVPLCLIEEMGLMLRKRVLSTVFPSQANEIAEQKSLLLKKDF